MNLFSRFTSASLIVGTLVLPTTSIAATSQQLLDQSLTRLILVQPSAFTGTLDITESKIPLLRNGVKSSQSAKLSFSYEQSLTSSSSQGFVQIDALKMSGAGASPTDELKLSEPVRATFRIVDDITYLKASPLSPILAMMGLGGIVTSEQIAPYERWMKVESSAGGSDILPMGLSFTKEEKALVDTDSLKVKLAIAAKKRISPIRVISTSPVKGYANMIRLRTKVNPAFVNLLEQQDLAQAGKNLSKRKEVQALYKAARESSKNLVLVFLIDTQNSKQPNITRVEFATTEISIKKGCGYARYTKAGVGIESSYSCTLPTYKSNAQLAGGINIVKKDAVLVEAPTDAVSLNDAFSGLFGLFLGETPSDLTTKETSGT